MRVEQSIGTLVLMGLSQTVYSPTTLENCGVVEQSVGLIVQMGQSATVHSQATKPQMMVEQFSGLVLMGQSQTVHSWATRQSLLVLINMGVEQSTGTTVKMGQ